MTTTAAEIRDDLDTIAANLFGAPYETRRVEMKAGLWTVIGTAVSHYAASSAGTFVIGDATDVTIGTPATGHLLRYNGTQWVNVGASVLASDLAAYFDATGTAAAALASHVAAGDPHPGYVLDADLTAGLATKVSTTRAVNTTKSLTGGGDLSSDRTFELVNDSASPGANMVYGTDAAGTKGWKADPSGSGSALSGALVKLTANQTTGVAGAIETVSWDAEEYDHGGWWDPANPDRLTVPAGIAYVRVGGQGYFQGSTIGSRWIYVYKNGTSFVGYPEARWSSTAYNNPVMTIWSAWIAVTPGDYFTFHRQSGAASQTVSQFDVWFAIEGRAS